MSPIRVQDKHPRDGKKVAFVPADGSENGGWQLLLSIRARWVTQQQQETVEYLRTEYRALRAKLGKKRIMLNDDQRSRLA